MNAFTCEEGMEAVEVGREAVPPSTQPPDLQPVSNEAPELVTGEESLLVRVTFRPDGFFYEDVFAPRETGGGIVDRLAARLLCQSAHLVLFWEGHPLRRDDTVEAICALPSDDLPLMLDAEVAQLPPHLAVLGPGDNAQYTLGVNVRYNAETPPTTFHVSIVRAFDRKPFLGGYRNKNTLSLFHHAATQCQSSRPTRIDMSQKVTRMTQTQGVTRSCQTRRECATQMARVDLLVDETYDRIVVAKPYFSADKIMALQIQKVVQLQAFVRGWRARRVARRLRQERDEEDLAIQLEDMRRREEHSRKKQDEIQRRMHPRTAADFNVLHNELEAWRLQEAQRISDADLTEEERRLALMELLRKQTRLLQTIDRLQIQASKENRVRRVNTVLNKMSSSKSWGTKSTAHVETPLTIRARELRDLYHGLQLTGLSVDERLDVLLHVKWTVKEFECILTREIVELVDREADLLNRGRKESTLSGLRQRLGNLFLQFVETPEFNPEAFHYQRVPLEHTHRPLVKLTKK